MGRVSVQGNLFDLVKDYKYVAQGTFDSFLYSTVEHKQRFIGQVFSNKPSVRSMDDIDETRISYSDLAAVASGNPDVKRIQELRSEIMSQSMLRQSHAETVANMRHQIESRYEPSARVNRRIFELLERDHDALDRANRQRELEKGSDIVRVSVNGVSAQDPRERNRDDSDGGPRLPYRSHQGHWGVPWAGSRREEGADTSGTGRYLPL